MCAMPGVQPVPHSEGGQRCSSVPSASLLSHWGTLVQCDPVLQHLTWLMQLDSLTLSEIWLYSSSQVGNFGGRRISTESRRSRLLPAEREVVSGVPMAGAVLGLPPSQESQTGPDCAPSARYRLMWLHRDNAGHPVHHLAPVAAPGAEGSTFSPCWLLA